MTTAFEVALARAKARADADAYEVPFQLYGEEFVFHFKKAFPQSAMEIIAEFENVEKAAGVSRTIAALTEFLDIMATEETAQEIATLLREEVLTFHDLIKLQTIVIERVSGRPIESSSFSADGSSTNGVPSTAGAVSDASILGNFHSIGS